MFNGCVTTAEMTYIQWYIIDHILLKWWLGKHTEKKVFFFLLIQDITLKLGCYREGVAYCKTYGLMNYYFYDFQTFECLYMKLEII